VRPPADLSSLRGWGKAHEYIVDNAVDERGIMMCISLARGALPSLCHGGELRAFILAAFSIAF
jgi:hypothetical protein